jgi:D-galactarolactone cycloisomerase
MSEEQGTHGPPALRPARLEVRLLRAPVDRPVRTSFAAMTSRPCLLVRVEDADGAFGWGEIWCNFPSCGPEHRARLAETVAGPLLLGRRFADPTEAFAELSRALRTLALQTGEPGPLAQVVAGLDLALWDLVARRAGLPLHRLLGGERRSVAVYASGIDPALAAETVARARAEGHRRFKVKIGFGAERDLQAIRATRESLAPGELFMVDANQRWALDEARAAARAIAPCEPLWLEEPLPADAPWPAWRALAQLGVPLAAGENLRGPEAFEAALESRTLAYLQPDLCKWGGISAGLPLARRIGEAGAVYCPHYLGGAVGLLASAQLLAAVGGPGFLEMDVNPNPLRSALCGPILPVEEGTAQLPEGPGLGAEPDPAVLRAFSTLALELRVER